MKEDERRVRTMTRFNDVKKEILQDLAVQREKIFYSFEKPPPREPGLNPWEVYCHLGNQYNRSTEVNRKGPDYPWVWDKEKEEWV